MRSPEQAGWLGSLARISGRGRGVRAGTLATHRGGAEETAPSPQPSPADAAEGVHGFASPADAAEGVRALMRPFKLHPIAVLITSGLCACTATPTSQPPTTPDNEPTLKSIVRREVAVEKDTGVVADETQAIAAYRRFLETAPREPQRSEALRRLGDLEMDGAENRSAGDATPAGTAPPPLAGSTPLASAPASSAPLGGPPVLRPPVTPNSPGNATALTPPTPAPGIGATAEASTYAPAIARYEDFLKTYPRDPGNDRVLYQLARAYEQGGNLEAALKTLDRLVAEFPRTPYHDEAQFRRGEMLFAMRDYAKAEKAYATVLQGDGKRNPFQERSLYMQGWSLYKQGRLDDALHPFLRVLDLKLPHGPAADESDLEQLPGLTRADRELVEDTFRVMSLCLSNLQGAESIPPYITSPARREYEFRIYQQLGELYIKQDRVKDAADTFGLFARLHPLHAQAPLLQTRVIEIYQQTGFATLALEAKKEYVVRYGVDSEFRRANPPGWERAQPLVKTHLTELARHHHALAQKTKSSADYQEAVRWYRAYIASFPNDPEAAQSNFLLAELLYEDSHFREASVEYENAAYKYPRHPKSADAGYAALLAYAAQEKRLPAAEQPPVQRTSVESSLRFARTFTADPRRGPVLTRAAEMLYALHDGPQATLVARLVLDLDPPATPEQRRVAWTVLAHTAFEAGTFDQAERGYTEVLALTPEKDPARNELGERLAASIYKQGEQARTAGSLRNAVGHFNRVIAVAPNSAVRVNAQYDAAAALIALKDWDAAARTLEDFRQRFPKHPLQDEVSAKLATAYLESAQWTQAALEFERVAATSKDPKLARAALWQAAELHEKAADKPEAKPADKTAARSAAAKSYERYLKQYPQPLEPALEARWRLARLAKADGNATREFALMKEIFQADQAGGNARTERTRYLGARGALALAAPAGEGYRKVALVEPLQKQLKLKKTKMEEALKAYTVAANYGVADVTTEATYHIASLYQDFGRSMLNSQRPKKLSKTELEQYNVLLEEQAFPFEEKAGEVHEVNARRAAQGLYDTWVQASFKALGELRPVRYGKTERSEAVIDAIR
jgi:cellulose synthase operon protein C